MPGRRSAAQSVLLAILASLAAPRPAASAAGSAAPPPPLAVSGIAGATYLTADMPAMLRYYGTGAGFAEAPAPPGAVRFAIGSRQWIEFLSVKDDNWPRRLQYVTLEAPGLEDIESSLRARGILADRIGSDPRTRVLQFEDPAGNRIRVAGPWSAPAAAPGAAAPFSTHLQHFGFAVPRPASEATLSFYRDTLGWPEAARMPGPDGQPAMVKFRIPGGRGEVAELIIFDKPLNIWAAGAIDHVKFDVADINAAYRSLHQGGIANKARGLPAVDADHLWAINIFDPEHTRLEIQELAPTGDAVGTVSAAAAAIP
jgi:catechol 2,3-dioxygenase-like lactoylglutathione lyase family enzyme